MIPRLLACITAVLLLCGCRSPDAVPDDGLAGQAGVHLACNELWIRNDGSLWGTLTIKNEADEAITLIRSLDNIRTGTELFVLPDPQACPSPPAGEIAVGAHSVVQFDWMSPVPVTEAWMTPRQPTPMDIRCTVSVYQKQRWEFVPVHLSTTLRWR